MAGKLIVLQGGGRSRADACGECTHYRNAKGTLQPRCDAFGGQFADWARGSFGQRCPGYRARPADKAAVEVPRRAGWLRRALIAFARWVW